MLGCTHGLDGHQVIAAECRQIQCPNCWPPTVWIPKLPPAKVLPQLKTPWCQFWPNQAFWGANEDSGQFYLIQSSKWSRGTTPDVRYLHWLPVNFRIHFKGLTLIFRASTARAAFLLPPCEVVAFYCCCFVSQTVGQKMCLCRSCSAQNDGTPFAWIKNCR